MASTFENAFARVRTSDEVLRTPCLAVRDRPNPDGQVVSSIERRVGVNTTTGRSGGNRSGYVGSP